MSDTIQQMTVRRIDKQIDRTLLYGDDAGYHVIAPKVCTVQVGDVISHEPYGYNFGWLAPTGPSVGAFSDKTPTAKPTVPTPTPTRRALLERIQDLLDEDECVGLQIMRVKLSDETLTVETTNGTFTVKVEEAKA